MSLVLHSMKNWCDNLITLPLNKGTENTNVVKISYLSMKVTLKYKLKVGEEGLEVGLV